MCIPKRERRHDAWRSSDRACRWRYSHRARYAYCASHAPETIIERRRRRDGFIVIESIVAIPRSNGNLDVRVEHYVVPSSNAASARHHARDDAHIPIMPEYLARVEYRVLPPGSRTTDVSPCRESPSHRIVDDVDRVEDEEVPFSEDFSSSSSFDGADVASVSRGRVNFEDDAFVISRSRTRRLGRRCRIVFGAMFVILVLIVFVGCIVIFGSRHYGTSSRDQHESPEEDEISNATSTDASMPANVPNVTGNRDGIPLRPTNLAEY